MGLVTSCVDQVDFEQEEKDLLVAAFKHGIVSQSKKNNLNWSNQIPLSKWQHVRTVPQKQRVARLDLIDCRIKGSIPHFHLQYLKDLNLSGNYFSGDVSWTTIVNLKNLEVLNLSMNRLSGQVNFPLLFKHLRNLSSIILSSNSFSGILTDDLWFDMPPTIAFFDIHDNDFEGFFSEDCVRLLNSKKLASYPYIDVSSLKGFTILSTTSTNNGGNGGDHGGGSGSSISPLSPSIDFSGPIDENGVSSLPYTANIFANPMSAHYSSVTSIDSIDRPLPLLQQDDIPVVSNTRDAHAIERLQLSKSSICGSMPILSFYRDLKILDISWNKITGTLPDTFFVEMPYLEYIDISHNNIDGVLPPLRQSSSLSRSRTSSDASGALNHSLSLVYTGTELSLLEVLRCNNNNFTGHLNSDSFAKMYRMKELDLSFNKFTISSTISLNHLPYIDMSLVFFIGNQILNVDPQVVQSRELVRRKLVSDENWARVRGFAVWVYYNKLLLNRLNYLENHRSNKNVNRSGNSCSNNNNSDSGSGSFISNSHVLASGGEGDGYNNSVNSDEDCRLSESIKASLNVTLLLNPKPNPNPSRHFGARKLLDSVSTLRLFAKIVENTDICRIIGSFI